MPTAASRTSRRSREIAVTRPRIAVVIREDGSTNLPDLPQAEPSEEGGLEIRIGDSRIRILDEAPERDFRAPTTLEGRTGMVHLYLPNAAEIFERAQKAGGVVVEPLNEQYWGDLSGVLEDPHGHRWFIAQRIEDLTSEEILSRGPTTPN